MNHIQDEVPLREDGDTQHHVYAETDDWVSNNLSKHHSHNRPNNNKQINLAIEWIIMRFANVMNLDVTSQVLHQETLEQD